MNRIYGNVKIFFAGMERICPQGHSYVVTEAMSRNGTYACSVCSSKKAVEWAKKHREQKRANNNAYLKRIGSKRTKYATKYKANHPDRKLAHQAVHTAIRNGTLLRLPCNICGEEKAHAHHDDYAKPLDVRWLCHQHHMQHHSMLKEAGK